MFYVLIWNEKTDETIKDYTVRSKADAIIEFLKFVKNPDEYDYQFAKENLSLNPVNGIGGENGDLRIEIALVV